jgi:ketosteroid isomerase-like protein
VTDEASIQLVRRLFEAFTRRDEGAMLALIASDMEFSAPTAAITRTGAPYVGQEGMRQYLSDAATVWRELRVIPQSFQAKGNCVLATGRVYARDHQGSIIDSPAGWLFLVRGDLLVSGRVFERADDAVAAFDARPDPA